MPTFFPPVTIELPRYHPDDSWSIKRARSFYRAEPTGVTVWVLDDGSVTTDRRYHSIDRHRIRHEYLGGHFHKISEAEAAVLIGAGFNINESQTSAWGLSGWGEFPWGT